MNCQLKLTSGLVATMREDLLRPHPFAAERVGFVACGTSSDPRNGLIVCARSYHPVADDDYIDDPRFGAVIGSGGFRMAFQVAYQSDAAILHVHLHGHKGRPRPSRDDLEETAKFVPDFFNVRPRRPHGALILSKTEMSCRIWTAANANPVPVPKIAVVGFPMLVIRTNEE